MKDVTILQHPFSPHLLNWGDWGEVSHNTPVLGVDEIPQSNAAIWEHLFAQSKAAYQYPADWLVRLWAIYLGQRVESGRVLDFACGAGSNAAFLAEKGYEVYGADVAPSAVRLASALLASRGLVDKPEDRFRVVPPDARASLPYPDCFFDIVLCSEALHYQNTAEAIRQISSEFRRCLRPGGIVIITTMGPRNVYIAEYGKMIGQNLYAVQIPGDRPLCGIRVYEEPLRFYVIPDEDEVRQTFDMFTPLTVGHYEQSMFDLHSTFHWIFVGLRAN